MSDFVFFVPQDTIQVMPTNLRNLLTEQDAGDGQPLFRSGRSLAEEIAKIPLLSPVNNGQPPVENTYFGKVEMTVSMINQFLRGDISAPESLERAIKEAVSVRLEMATPAIGKRWAHQVAFALQDYSSHKPANEYWQETLQAGLLRAAYAEDFVLLYTGVAESVADLYVLREILPQRLGLARNFLKPTARFTFFEVDRQYSEKAWERLLYQVAGLTVDAQNDDSYIPLAFDSDRNLISYEHGVEEAAERIAHCEQEGFLRTFVVPEIVTGVPVIALDPDSRVHDAVGYIIFLNDQTPKTKTNRRINVETVRYPGVEIQVLRMPTVYLDNWLRRVYRPLIERRVQGVEEIPFSSVRERIVNEAKFHIRQGHIPVPNQQWGPSKS